MGVAPNRLTRLQGASILKFN